VSGTRSRLGPRVRARHAGHAGIHRRLARPSFRPAPEKHSPLGPERNPAVRFAGHGTAASHGIHQGGPDPRSFSRPVRSTNAGRTLSRTPARGRLGSRDIQRGRTRCRLPELSRSRRIVASAPEAPAPATTTLLICCGSTNGVACRVGVGVVRAAGSSRSPSSHPSPPRSLELRRCPSRALESRGPGLVLRGASIHWRALTGSTPDQGYAAGSPSIRRRANPCRGGNRGRASIMTAPPPWRPRSVGTAAAATGPSRVGRSSRPRSNAPLRTSWRSSTPQQRRPTKRGV
jgi:hypothetical protein